MHHQRIEQGPARPRLRHDVFQRLLGHAGIVFQGERIDALAVQALAHVHLAHQADEHRQPTDPPVALGQAVELGADIEISFLDAHGHGVSRR